MNDKSFAAMRDIGEEYGLSSHKLGKFLTENGYRESGQPTKKAFANGWVKQQFAPNGLGYAYYWHVGKTRALLEWRGHERQESHSDKLDDKLSK